MLTASQVTTVAYISDGGFVHPQCIPGFMEEAYDQYFDEHKEDTGRFGWAGPSVEEYLDEEMGYQAIARYTLDEYKAEEAYSEAEWYASDMDALLRLWDGDLSELIQDALDDKWSGSLEQFLLDSGRVEGQALCDECGEEIDP